MTVDPHYTDDAVTVYPGDCLAVLAELPDGSVDAVVTDPPYGLEFMGAEWDSFRPSSARIRTRIDGRTNPASGKSVTVTPEAYVAGAPFQQWCQDWAAECLRVLKPGGHMLAFGGSRTWHRLAAAVEDAGFEVRDSIAWLYGSGFPKSLNLPDGRGTALKPAFEPIVVGRKPLAGTVAQNVTEHGTGALNIDGCRIPHDGTGVWGNSQNSERHRSALGYRGGEVGSLSSRHDDGRWPANVVLDEATAVGLETARFFYTAKASANERPEVDGVRHPTVKPLSLMRWLVRLVTPPGGTVLDPFAGSGTTAEACVLEHLRCIAIEREASYLPLIVARLSKPIAVGFDFNENAEATVPSESGDQFVMEVSE